MFFDNRNVKNGIPLAAAFLGEPFGENNGALPSVFVVQTLNSEKGNV